jgi:hypothetical protein
MERLSLHLREHSGLPVGEAIEGWYERSGVPRGEVPKLARTWELSEAWYGDRLSLGFWGKTVEEADGIFGRLGLGGAFWRS